LIALIVDSLSAVILTITLDQATDLLKLVYKCLLRFADKHTKLLN